ncbi:uncharacterized protein B0I36DRAFT_343954 [Microdochium trichocladiopsis]|uniref:Uncharacterized protein n=1 Tax=Microdochium trichocladiopsis TaxID=1682393 RepID=A0A9P9BTN3_9PEZI|nr:uncharacterized protein B0I36DRAFT_343954 [Microdochium trichocladiopsis]KAH7040166.1 hypothetical protein B0I36DRAFT_343954 [Microdochium trichocladiopsis]
MAQMRGKRCCEKGLDSATRKWASTYYEVCVRTVTRLIGQTPAPSTALTRLTPSRQIPTPKWLENAAFRASATYGWWESSLPYTIPSHLVLASCGQARATGHQSPVCSQVFQHTLMSPAMTIRTKTTGVCVVKRDDGFLPTTNSVTSGCFESLGCEWFPAKQTLEQSGMKHNFPRARGQYLMRKLTV